MKSCLPRYFLWSLLFLFFFQFAGTLVESVYILDLLNTSLDEKALGLLFFFTPVLLFLFRGKTPGWLMYILVAVLTVCRSIIPYLPTAGRLFLAGVSVGTVLIFLVLLQNDSRIDGLKISGSLAFATALSVLLRTAGFGIDYSMTIPGAWLGGVLAAGLPGFYSVYRHYCVENNRENSSRSFSSSFGFILILSLLFFSFSAPSVVARWVEGNYALTVIPVSLLTCAYSALALLRPGWMETVLQKKNLPAAVNVFFTLAMLSMFLVHRVNFPGSPEAPAIPVTPSSFLGQIPLLLTLLSSPILFFDAALFADSSRSKKKRSMISGILAGLFIMLVMLFMQIFTNIWGYVEPVSPYFRNQFYLPFLLLSGGICVLVLLNKSPAQKQRIAEKQSAPVLFLTVPAVCAVLTAGAALWTVRSPRVPEEKNTLTLMTYNIQQANDRTGRKSYLRQLENIRKINPDILALQESDSARIGLNNNDYVRYFSSQLGYYSYYGPATSAGTYGTAVLSRYPLENKHTVYSYSDLDEIGITAVEIVVDGRRFSVFNVHPDGSDTAMSVFAQTILEQAENSENVIILGDFNLRNTDEALQSIAEFYHNVPGSEGHIDHIFLSQNLQMVNPVYVSAPDSASDHPFLSAEIKWK